MATYKKSTHMKKLLISVGISLGLVGCASPAYNYQAVPKNISKPPLNTVNTAFIGDKMLEQGMVVDREVLQASTDTKIGFSYSLTSGYYQKTGENEKGSYYKPINNITNGGMVQKNPFADPFKVVMLGADGQLCVVTVFNAKACTNKHETKQTIASIASDNSFQQTLIYSGKVGNKINVGYREFSSNLARPAFNNDVEYDLNQSKQIGYKGAILEVVDANNQSITYKVLRNFNKTD